MPIAKNPNGLAPDELMKKIGAPGWDPIDRTHYLMWQDESQPEHLRIWAWMCAHTIRVGHRSPYAVGPDGTPKTVQDLMVDLKLRHYSNVIRTLEKCQSQGWFRKEGDKLMLVGNVKKPITADQQSERLKTMATFPKYLQKSVGRLPEEARQRFLTKWNGLNNWSRQAEAEALLCVRRTIQQYQDILCDQFSLEKRSRASPDDAATILSVHISQTPDFIASNSVQIIDKQNHTDAVISGKVTEIKQLSQLVDNKPVTRLDDCSEKSVQNPYMITPSLLTNRAYIEGLQQQQPGAEPPATDGKKTAAAAPPPPQKPDNPTLRKGLAIRGLNSAGELWRRIVEAADGIPVRELLSFLDAKRKEKPFGPALIPALCHEFAERQAIESDPETAHERERIARETVIPRKPLTGLAAALENARRAQKENGS